MSIATAPADVALARRAPARTRPWYLDVWVQMVRRKPLGTMGGAIVVVMLAAAVGAEWISPYGFSQTSLLERLTARQLPIDALAQPLGPSRRRTRHNAEERGLLSAGAPRQEYVSVRRDTTL